MAKLFANSGDPDPMLHFAASDLGLHCLTITFYRSPDYNGLKGLCVFHWHKFTLKKSTKIKCH